MGARGGKRHLEEEHVNHERWLISYADMITLLMVLFVVMFAISQVDQKKFDELKTGTTSGFGETTSAFQGADGIMADASTPMDPAAPLLKPSGADAADDVATSSTPEADAAAVRAENQRQAESRTTEATAEVRRLSAVERRVRTALRAQGLQDDVRIVLDERGLTLSMVSEHVVFAADRAELTRRGVRVTDALAGALAGVPDQLEVAGHTNQVAVKPRFFPTEWELSAARATTVLRRMQDVGRVPGKRLTAVAHGDEIPLVDPDDPSAARVNKRVDITVLSDAPQETRALFTQVLEQERKRRQR
ncbi:flagellar motor protein MotB [Solicola sp. PLA-1-18]|uniref:flagellar motor protein MotB n=1 Tax=Solicola sp. PLA-1-18 TaxID=3380532 RepID=UPI003B7A5864